MELLFTLTAALSIGILGFVHVEAALAKRSSGLLAQPSPGGGHTVALVQETRSGGPSKVIGTLEVRDIGLSVPIMSDFGTGSLLKGIGHVPGTAMAGGLGTLGLAGHRDTYFKPLSRIAAGMDIRVGDATGTYHYRVDSTEVVKPEQTEVLDVRNIPELTLITCYPFHYVGAAPLRFIVHAHLLSVVPDA